MATKAKGGQAKELSWLPPSHFHFDALLISEIFHRLKISGYLDEQGKIHVAVLRRFVRRLVDGLDLKASYDVEAFAVSSGDAMLTFEETRLAACASQLGEGALKPVPLNLAERICLVFQDGESCVLARIWSILLYLVIFLNVGLIILQSLPNICPRDENGEEIRCFHEQQLLCIALFSVDYFVRLLCAPLCRVSVLEKETLIESVVPEDGTEYDPFGKTSQKRSPWQRLYHFTTKPMHVIDVLAILPFWLRVTIGDVCPFPLTFLRALRLLRFFRVMKFGRFNFTLAVLGSTLSKSMQSMYVLMLWVCVTSLLAGAVLQQIESENGGDNFLTVPSATWWIFTRMMSFQHSVNWAEDVPTSVAGGLLVSSISVFKAILWILPFGMIGGIFTEEWKHHNEHEMSKKRVQAAENRRAGSDWIDSPLSPCARVEILAQAADGSDSVLQAAGDIPLPLLEAKWGADQAALDVVTVGLIGNAMRPLFRFGSDDPSITFEVQWQPDEGSNPVDYQPKGDLRLKPICGDNFLGARGQLWICRVSLLVSMETSELEVWESSTQSALSSAETASSPQWEEDGKVFQINWGSGAPSLQKDPSSPTPAQRLENLMEENSRHLQQAAETLEALGREAASQR